MSNDLPVNQNFSTSEIDDNKLLEFSFTHEQYKLLQKILPVGYSLSLADKTQRKNNKRGIIHIILFKFGRNI